MLNQQNGVMNAAGTTMGTVAATEASAEMVAFQLPDMVEGEFSAEELAEDMDGMQMSLQRIKIPGGGTLQFEMTTDDPENPEYIRYLEGVILYNHASNAYWPEGSEYDENTTPLCSSVDGKWGMGEPGGTCATCSLNSYGSAPEGRGKACKNMRVLYLLRSGEYMPLQLNLPPTSLSPFKDFLNKSFTLRRRATYGSVVQIGLRKMSNGGNDYGVATFRRLYDFTGEQLKQMKTYADGFKEQMKATLQQRVTMNEEQREEECDYTNVEQLPVGTGEAFCIGAEIDGEREALPA